MTQHKDDTTIRTVFEIINAGGMENFGKIPWAQCIIGWA